MYKTAFLFSCANKNKIYRDMFFMLRVVVLLQSHTRQSIGETISCLSNCLSIATINVRGAKFRRHSDHRIPMRDCRLRDLALT